ncbi:hypothetical protein [Helicobacter sp. T3_23-1059]
MNLNQIIHNAWLATQWQNKTTPTPSTPLSNASNTKSSTPPQAKLLARAKKPALSFIGILTSIAGRFKRAFGIDTRTRAKTKNTKTKAHINT